MLISLRNRNKLKTNVKLYLKLGSHGQEICMSFRGDNWPAFSVRHHIQNRNMFEILRYFLTCVLSIPSQLAYCSKL